MRKVFRRGLLGAGVLSGAFGAYVASNESRRRKFTRGVDFWTRAMPMYLTYRLEEFKQRNSSERDRDAAFAALHEVHAPIAIQNILHMRGLYIKLGQMMTTRADYAPPAFMRALGVLQDAVPARPFAEIAEDVRRELGVEKLSDLFLSIEEQPLGAATIGQVHGAVLLNGDRVVIKFQYPEVEELFNEDLETVALFCRLLQPEMTPMMDEMSRQFKTEFDFGREGWALETIREGVTKRFGPHEVRIPRPYREMCTRRVCVMERFDGVKLVDGFKKYYSQLAAERGMTLEQMQAEQERTGRQAVTGTQMQLHRAALQLFNAGAGAYNWTLGLLLPNVAYRSVPPNHIHIIDTLVKVHGFEIFELGTFNGDPHPGNIWLMDDGALGLIDYGQVKQLTPHQIRDLAKLVVALSTDDSQTIIKAFTEFGFRSEKMDPWVVERTARYFFQDDTKPELLKRKDGTTMNFQQVMEYLNKEDATVEFPEYAFLVVRCAMLIRGLASHFGVGVDVAKRWEPYAREALQRTEYLEHPMDQLHAAESKTPKRD